MLEQDMSFTRVQKRILDWSTTLEKGGIANPELRQRFGAALHDLRAAVAEAWDRATKEGKTELDSEYLSRIQLLEHRMEILNEEARFSIKSSTPLLKETTFSRHPD